MVIGLGALGSRVLDGLMHVGPKIGVVIAAGRDEAKVRARANLSLFSAMQATQATPSLECAQLDLSDFKLSADTLSRLQPDVIINCATMQPYGSIAALSLRRREHLEAAGLGPWLPTHLALADRLMKAVGMLEMQPHVVNCAYPDAVNPLLFTLYRAPLVGAGNIGNNVPAICRVVADHAGATPAAVRLSMVMHHYVSHRVHRFGNSGGAPFHLAYEVDTEAPKKRLRPEDVFRRLAHSYPRAQGDAGRLMPAAAAVAVVRGLLGDQPRALHTPGPIGHIGGTPVLLSRQRLTITLPLRMSVVQAMAINSAGQRYDGIASIEQGGKVAFTETAQREFRQALGHDLEAFRIEESWELASELVTRAEQVIDR